MEAKPWYQSKVVWGVVLTLAAIVVGRYGVAIPTDNQTASDVTDVATKVGEVVGLLFLLWRRVRSQESPVTLTRAAADALK